MSDDHILTTHTGSLPRPKDILAVMDASATDTADFAAHVKRAVADAVRRQRECGLDVVNDGEMSKTSYATYVKDRLSGFGRQVSTRPSLEQQEFPEFSARRLSAPGRSHVKRFVCESPVELRDRQQVLTDVSNLQAALAGADPATAFMTAASPGVISVFMDNEYYDTHAAYVFALAEAMKYEYETIAAAGFVLQVDCPDLAMARTSLFAGQSLDAFRRFAETNIAALNHALSAIPPERVRVHVCWGNYDGPHNHDVPLSDIIDVVMKARCQGIVLEAANPRHEYEWEVFEEIGLPDDKLLVVGVIDSTNNYIEHPRLIAQRIVRYARVVGRERVMAGVDCGLSTFAGSALVDPRIAWAKLQTLTEGARLATSQLW